MHSEVQIISVLGPPGSGKGSQCSRLQEDYQCTHLSVGDLLRAEIKKGGPFAEIIQENMSCGRIGPKDLTAQIMKENIEKSLKRGITTIFLDGQ
jgi:UMP-CMP kinase